MTGRDTIDERWTKSFIRSQEALERLADEALREHRAGTTRPIEELIDDRDESRLTKLINNKSSS